MPVSELKLDISVANPGLRMPIPESAIDEYRRNPLTYVANYFGATATEVRCYLLNDGAIQCGHIRNNGLRCRNQHGVHSALGSIEFCLWVQLHRHGWYCNVHGG